MIGMLEKDGILILTCPYNLFDENVYVRPDAVHRHARPYIGRSYSRAQLEGWLSCGAVLEERELWRLYSGPVWATGQMIPWERRFRGAAASVGLLRAAQALTGGLTRTQTGG